MIEHFNPSLIRDKKRAFTPHFPSFSLERKPLVQSLKRTATRESTALA